MKKAHAKIQDRVISLSLGDKPVNMTIHNDQIILTFFREKGLSTDVLLWRGNDYHTQVYIPEYGEMDLRVIEDPNGEGCVLSTYWIGGDN